MELTASHEEIREIRELNVSAKPQQSTRDSNTTPTSINSTFEISISRTTQMHPQMPTEEQALQALMALQDSIPDTLQVKNAHSTEFS